jgi:hypothetical protein
MRNRLFFLFTILIWSCNNNKSKNNIPINEVEKLVDSLRFSEKIDTFYQQNSTKISQITRLFYSYTLYPEKTIINSDNINNKKELELIESNSKEFKQLCYLLTIKNGYKFSVVVITSKKGLLKFFENAGLLFSNPDKNFRFSIGEEENFPALIIGNMEH